MKTKILMIAILILLSSCNKNTEQKQLSLKSNEKLKTNTQQENFTQNNIKLDATKLELLPKNIEWTNQGNVFVFFRQNKVYFNFSISCAYWFPSKIIDNDIEFYWEMNEDCTYDVGIKKYFSGIKNPELGKPFGKIKILNDTILYIDYYYSDWITKINNELTNNDTLFPTYLIKVELNY